MVDSFLLQENGDFLFQENGGKIILQLGAEDIGTQFVGEQSTVDLRGIMDGRRKKRITFSIHVGGSIVIVDPIRTQGTIKATESIPTTSKILTGKQLPLNGKIMYESLTNVRGEFKVKTLPKEAYQYHAAYFIDKTKKLKVRRALESIKRFLEEES